MPVCVSGFNETSTIFILSFPSVTKSFFPPKLFSVGAAGDAASVVGSDVISGDAVVVDADSGAIGADPDAISVEIDADAGVGGSAVGAPSAVGGITVGVVRVAICCSYALTRIIATLP